jgi:Ca-activated chloride channel family protein
MNISTDDPKLTAYALGELGEGERREIERDLARSVALRAAVEEIRAAANALQKEFASEGKVTPRVDAVQILTRAEAADKIVPFPRRAVAFTAVITTLAACAVAVLAWQFWFNDTQPKPVTVAQVRTPMTVFVTNSSTVSSAPLIVPVLVPTPAHGAERARPAAMTNVPQQATIVRRTNQTTLRVAQLVAEAKQLTESNLLVEAESKLNTALNLDPGNHEAAYYLDSVYARSFAQQLLLRERGSKNMGFAASFPQSQLPSDSLRAKGPASGFGGKLNQSVSGVSSGVGGAYGGPGLNLNSGNTSPGVSRVPLETDPAAALGAGTVFSYNQVGAIDQIAIDQIAIVNGSDSKKEYYYAESERSGLNVSGPETRFRKIGEVPAPGYTFKSSIQGASSNPGYVPLSENPFRPARENPLSTFSIDVDTGSYANVRRFLNSNQLPPRDAVRIEELINYFTYRYAPPTDEQPFSANIESAGCPWKAGHRLLRVALKGKELARDKRPPSNFVFLIDVSGSMQPAERLPLIKQGLRSLVKRMTESDLVAIVVYASEAGVKLASTSCANKEKILAAIDALEAAGSTNGEGGIREAYRVATENFIKGGVNRVLLCTDGDFNVGVSDQNQLVQMIQEKAKTGVYLTTLGVGTDNFKDALMHKLADKGNGNYHYLDSQEEAQKVLVEQMNANFVTIAKDVKIQIEFNPAQVGAYRLLGYEKRLLRKEDFNDDTKDAGEIGAGHTVTALYEIIPSGAEMPTVDGLKYQKTFARPVSLNAADSDTKEMLTLKLRYKKPDSDTSQLTEIPYTDSGASYGRASSDFRFAAAVASFGMLLRDSQFRGGASFDAVLELAEAAKGDDENGYRAEFINLVKKAQGLKR